MSSVFTIDTDKMKILSGNVSSYCEENNLDRRAIYNINGNKRHNSKANQKLANRMIHLGVAEWKQINQNKGE